MACCSPSTTNHLVNARACVIIIRQKHMSHTPVLLHDHQSNNTARTAVERQRQPDCVLYKLYALGLAHVLLPVRCAVPGDEPTA